MPIKITTTHVCDHCDRPIDTDGVFPWVDATTHGAIFHAECWDQIGGPRVARVLGLDEIVFRDGGRENECAWGPR